MSLVTIIIPVYNAQQFLDHCIKSVVNQTYRELEIILIDDGSSDDSAAICERWANVDTRIRVIRQQNQGPSVARNVGINCAHGEYLQFVDSDDWLDSTMTERLVAAIQKSHADVVFCTMCFEYKSHQKKCDYLVTSELAQPMESLWREIQKTPYHVYFGSACNKLYQKEHLKQCRFPQNTLQAEDYIFNLDYFFNCQSFCVAVDCTYHYRVSQQNSLSTGKRSFDQKTQGWKNVYCHVSRAFHEFYGEIPRAEIGSLQIRFFCWLMLDYTMVDMCANRQSIMNMISDDEIQASACCAKPLAQQHRLFAFLIRNKAFIRICALVAVYHFVTEVTTKLQRFKMK